MERYQITAFVKIEGRLMTPATSICIKKSSDKDVREVSIEGMFRVIEKTHSDKFDVNQFKQTFLSSASQIEHDAAVTFCHEGVEFILMRTMPGVNPERLISMYDLTNASVQGVTLVKLVGAISESNNFTHVKDQLYLVRNQSGLKHAFKHHCELQKIKSEVVLATAQTIQHGGHDLSYYPGHPTEYPALVSITNDQGDTELNVSWVSTKLLKEMLGSY